MQNQNKEIRFYSIGGTIIKLISLPFEENDFVSAFRCSPADETIAFDVSMVPSVSSPRGKVISTDGFRSVYENSVITMRDEVSGGLLYSITPVDEKNSKVEFLADRTDAWGNKMFLSIINLPGWFLSHGGLFLHSSFIGVNGNAIVFTASKQVGKSTQAELWRKHRGADVVNGDRTLIVEKDDTFFACGSPYCGTSGICHNKMLPLKAVVVLSQAPENKASFCSSHEAIAAMLNGASFDVSDVSQVDSVIALSERIIEKTDFIKLECTPDESAVKALEETIWNRNF